MSTGARLLLVLAPLAGLALVGAWLLRAAPAPAPARSASPSPAPGHDIPDAPGPDHAERAALPGAAPAAPDPAATAATAADLRTDHALLQRFRARLEEVLARNEAASAAFDAQHGAPALEDALRLARPYLAADVPAQAFSALTAEEQAAVAEILRRIPAHAARNVDGELDLRSLQPSDRELIRDSPLQFPTELLLQDLGVLASFAFLDAGRLRELEDARVQSLMRVAPYWRRLTRIQVAIIQAARECGIEAFVPYPGDCRFLSPEYEQVDRDRALIEAGFRARVQAALAR
ncbi:MAG: hypothetical protein EYC70_07640 [Planctomycetota bacterium]|nr:MAG: hypothetical protein EYC70_07640 [Planctomycetota bacterium]